MEGMLTINISDLLAAFTTGAVFNAGGIILVTLILWRLSRRIDELTMRMHYVQRDLARLDEHWIDLHKTHHDDNHN